MNEKYLLKLYVTGRTERSERAIANLRRICDEQLAGAYEVRVIDVLENPQLAEDERILATPTLVKELPPPIRRLLGDLSDTDRVLLGLDIRASLAPRGAEPADPQ
jgi:circadian clock protein KaiB